MLVYLFGVGAAGSFWLTAFLMDQETPKTDVKSWALLTIAALLWPVSVPGACIELLHAVKVGTVQENTLVN